MLATHVREWLSAHLLDVDRVDRIPPESSVDPEADWSAQVWSVWDRLGQRHFLKQHRQRRKFDQELQSYQRWVTGLPSSPQLIAADPERMCLLLTAVPGEVSENVELTREHEQELHFRAGRFLRDLHAQPHEDLDAMPLTEAIRARFDHWCSVGQEAVGSSDFEFARREFTVEYLRDESRVPVHHDFQPRNWLTGPDGAYFIDFEHAFPDHWLLDWVKLWSHTWVDRQDLEGRFSEGYGYELSSEDRLALRSLAILHGVATIVWGVRHGVANYEKHGREVLARLRLGRLER